MIRINVTDARQQLLDLFTARRLRVEEGDPGNYDIDYELVTGQRADVVNFLKVLDLSRTLAKAGEDDGSDENDEFRAFADGFAAAALVLTSEIEIAKNE